MLLKYVASEVVYLQNAMLYTCSARSVYLQSAMLYTCRSRSVYLKREMLSTWRSKSVYLLSQKHFSCIARNSLRAEPRVDAMARPDAHILSHANLDMERDLKD